MSTRDVTRAGVVGLGTMGAGIAQLCVQAGIPTVAVETTPELAEGAGSRIGKALGKLAEKGTISVEQRDETFALLEPTADVGALAGCDLVIEAVFESLEVKHELFVRLEAAVAAETVLATNTSALSVSEIAAPLSHPERVVGMHFFNPAPVLPLVEVVRAQATSDAAFDTAYAFAQKLGKDPIACVDTPGFVVNRILIPVLNDAVRVLDQGVASPEDIDKGMRLGTNWPIGPLALIDLIGVDTYVHVCHALSQSLREQRFAPPETLVQMLESGRLGRKSGQGFFEYATA
jgi:3-hydroxybutyryl-CoA dehydrogenase